MEMKLTDFLEMLEYSEYIVLEDTNGKFLLEFFSNDFFSEELRYSDELAIKGFVITSFSIEISYYGSYHGPLIKCIVDLEKSEKPKLNDTVNKEEFSKMLRNIYGDELYDEISKTMK